MEQVVTHSRGPLRVVLALYLVTATAWAWLNPVFEAPDEPFHVAYVNLLVRERRWPHASEIARTARFLEAHTAPSTYYEVFESGQSSIFLEWAQPPLYYVLQAPVLAAWYPEGFQGTLVPAKPDFPFQWDRGFFRHHADEARSWARPVAAVRSMRLLSVALGAVVISCTAWIARRVRPANAQLPVLSAALLAFVPQYSFITASVNNDVLGYLVGALGVMSLLRIARHAWTPGRAGVMLGGLLGVGAMSKMTTLFLWPLAAVVVGVTYRRSWADGLRCGAGLVAMAAAVSWWFIAERLGAYGDQLAFALAGQPSGWVTFSTPFLGLPAEPTLPYWINTLQRLWESYWGQFGWGAVRIAPDALTVYGLLALLALTGWAWARRTATTGAAERAAVRVLLGAIAMFGLCTVLVYRRVFIPQGGRYLLTVGPALAIFMALGLLRVQTLIATALDRRCPPHRFVLSVVALMAGLNWLVLSTSICRTYYRG